MDAPIVPSAAGIKALADLCSREGVEELEAANLGWSVRLRLEPRGAPASVEAPARADTQGPTSPHIQVSQWVGVFHRAAEQGADPLAREGRHVREGDPVGVVIAMQLLNDVRAERDGAIVRFLVEDGGAVEYGQPLLELA